MAFQQIENIRLRGIAACVPTTVEENRGLSLFANEEEFRRFADTTGVYRRRVVREETCSSDLCCAAAEKLLEELKWDRNEIECLIFLSQTPDYIYPATACILQDRLGLSKECMAFDISLGCSGWIYGLSVIASVVSASRFKKGLLLVGDTSTKTKSPLDKSSYPLFGDAGTATAVEFDAAAPAMLFDMHTDGGGASAIMIRDGGFRHPFSNESLQMKEWEDGNKRTALHSYLDGASVFTFGISRAPKSIRALLEKYDIDRESVDYFILHQANKIMMEKIRNKLGIPLEKTPYIIRDFGNTSSTSVPLNIVNTIGKDIGENCRKVVACAFGVGLSWGSVYLELDHVVCPDLVEI